MIDLMRDCLALSSINNLLHFKLRFDPLKLVQRPPEALRPFRFPAPASNYLLDGNRRLKFGEGFWKIE
jgi:hypothetical protein